MKADLDQVSPLIRREIEARITGPLIKAFIDKFGREESLDTVQSMIRKLALGDGAKLAEALGSNSLMDFAKGMSAWTDGDTLQMHAVELTENTYFFDMTRCRYAEMYRALSLADLGYTLSCGRDSSFVEGFNPEITLTRTQTIMEGAAFCDFRYTMANG